MYICIHMYIRSIHLRRGVGGLSLSMSHSPSCPLVVSVAVSFLSHFSLFLSVASWVHDISNL